MHRSRSCARSRSGSRGGAAVGAACLLVLGCIAGAPRLVGLGGSPVPSGPRGPVVVGSDPGVPRIRWGACPEQPVPDGMRCGKLTVPLDHDHPGKGTIDIALARIPATAPRGRRLGSLVLNFGGPGGPGIETLAADPKPYAELGERYDLVAFDPRGVGHSAPVSCGGSLEPDPGTGTGSGTRTATADAAAQLAALRAVVKRCERASGPVLPYVGTVNVSRDMELIRRALGDDKLNYLGFSYGTRLGAVYTAQYPGRVGRMVLDGVDTLTESLTEQALVSARGQQQALDNFLTWCTHRKEGCVYGTNTRTAKKETAALVAHLDAHPLVDADGARFTGEHAVTAISAALYSKQLWPDLAQALADVERKGDPRGLLRLSTPDGPEPTDPGPPGPVPADNGEAALAAVNCADDPDRDYDKADPGAIEKKIEGLRAEFRQASEIFGPRQLMTVLSCYGRPAGTDFIRRIDRPGAPRMLLVGTRGDPATPYQWTEETAERLGSAVVLDYKGDGHTGYTASRCVRGYVTRFLVDGRLPSGTRSCPAGE
ncbi:alpha/beta hydrolase [Streptomyces sp. NPDC032472]|uniref:alpha/beta hydrolase n=1 Tax=Streptomyces sp. NPDC032472 TaxID=3155018 RepID=UPI0033D3806E